MYFSNNEILEEISEIKLLGVFIENSLKWTKNTDYICQKARQRIWLLRNMKKSGLTLAELIDAYIKEVRSLLEMAVPVWHSGLTKEESHQIERVQKAALTAIIGQNDLSYRKALELTKLDSLYDRRQKICLKFITKNINSQTPLLSKTQKCYNTRDKSKVVNEYQCRTSAFFNSPLPFLARLFNASVKNA